MSEAARGAIEDGFLRVCLSEIVSMTAIGNLPSCRVMERLGMEQWIEFEHPRLQEKSLAKACALSPPTLSGNGSVWHFSPSKLRETAEARQKPTKGEMPKLTRADLPSIENRAVATTSPTAVAN